MKNWNASVGSTGEETVCDFLRKNGHTVLGRNYRMPGGEIDIIARAPDGTLVFVEVKTLARERADGLVPEDEMSSSKMRKTRRAAELYANAHADLVRDDRGWRIDVIAVVLTDPPTIRHYESI